MMLRLGTVQHCQLMINQKNLQQSCLKHSKDFGQKAVAILTDMSSPLGYAIGNWVEIKECIEIMNPELNKSPHSKDLIDVTLYLAGAMLMVAGKCDSIKAGIKLY